MVLTKKEKDIILAIAKHGMNAMCGKEPKSLHDDNFSWFVAADLVDGGYTDLTIHQVTGVMATLYQKQLIQESDGDWHLVEQGINEAQKLWEAK